MEDVLYQAIPTDFANDLDATNQLADNRSCRRFVRDKEVAMMETDELRIDVEAARALACWRARFADEVSARARRFAAESGNPYRVTLDHYRQAAPIAMRSLAAAILEGGLTSDDWAA